MGTYLSHTVHIRKTFASFLAFLLHRTRPQTFIWPQRHLSKGWQSMKDNAIPESRLHPLFIIDQWPTSFHAGWDLCVLSEDMSMVAHMEPIIIVFFSFLYSPQRFRAVGFGAPRASLCINWSNSELGCGGCFPFNVPRASSAYLPTYSDAQSSGILALCMLSHFLDQQIQGAEALWGHYSYLWLLASTTLYWKPESL